MKVIVVGGDGFCGWPTSLDLAAQGHEVVILDNLSRRAIDLELGTESLTPIASMQDRISAASAIGAISWSQIDIATEYERTRDAIDHHRPDAIVHFGEQRAAPYSMIGDRQRRYTVDNNARGTHNLLSAIVEIDPAIHLVHLGTMGVYGYSKEFGRIPEGYLDVTINSTGAETDILYPANPGSIYHMTKCLDQLLFAFYTKNWGLRITDLHQGIVWGTHTDQTRRHPQLINRFDYDGDYGTVLNRFLIQAAIDYPLTVHGTGGQTRAFIHLQDSVRCIALALSDPPAAGDRVKIFNQMTETHRVRDLAELVAQLTGARVAYLPNPRKEAAENDLFVKNDQFLALGLNPTTLGDGLLDEVVEVARKFAHRIDRSRVPAVSAWTKDIAKRVETDPERKRFKTVS